jgi:hypothetical protein
LEGFRIKRKERWRPLLPPALYARADQYPDRIVKELGEFLRRIANFLLWLGLFGLFLSFAAYSAGTPRFDIGFISVMFIGISAWVLRKPVAPFEPSRRFRTLRKFGMSSRGQEKKED